MQVFEGRAGWLAPSLVNEPDLYMETCECFFRGNGEPVIQPDKVSQNGHRGKRCFSCSNSPSRQITAEQGQ
jgi:hypothetical protein